MRVNANERDEIAASVAAHAELGPRYDTAVAEGLVERIGEEIDKRIDARLHGQPERQGQPGGQGQRVPDNHAQPPAYQGPIGAPTMPVAVPPPWPATRRSYGVTGVILGLGSMGLGVGATAVVVNSHVASVAALFMVLLIWAAIAGINIAHSQRRL